MSANLLNAAESLASIGAENADRSERDRSLAPEVAKALAASPIPAMLVPAALGGGERNPAEMVAALSAIAAGDGSAAWCAMVAATSGLVAAYVEREFAREAFAPPEVAGGVYAPMGRAAMDGGEYVVSGRWPFTSGCKHATTLMGGALVAGDGAPEVRAMVFPASQAVIHETWDTTGLRGTGSHDMEVADLVVPAGRTASLYGDTPRETGPLYAFPVFGLLALAITGVGLGIARGAVQDLVELAGGKVPSLQVKTLASQTDTQLRVAKAEASLRAARALVSEAIGEAWTEAEHDGGVTLERRAALRMAASHAMVTSAEVVGEMYSLAGGSAIYDDNSLQRRFRDIHVATQHTMVGPPSWQVAGRVLLGVPVRPEQF